MKESYNPLHNGVWQVSRVVWLLESKAIRIFFCNTVVALLSVHNI